MQIPRPPFVRSLVPILAVVAGCATTADPGRGVAGSAAEPVAAALAAAPAQGPMSRTMVHPRTMATLGVAFGESDFEVNTGTGIVATNADALFVRATGEHFWASELGVYVDGAIGSADDIDEDVNNSPDSSLDTTRLFLAVSYRATMDDDFRLPVRFGPFFQETEQDDVLFGAGGAVTGTLFGVRLSVEPEYIVFQKEADGRLSELTVFAELACATGPTEVENNLASEDGYGFTFNWEVGLRYKLPIGVLAGLSFLSQKEHFDTTESYNGGPNSAFFGTDYDFTGIAITAGVRF
jgi:hypothetical protein